MKGTPRQLDGPLTSKPTWSNTSGCSTTSAFFCFRCYRTAAWPQGIVIGLLLLIILIVLLMGGLPTWNHSQNWGYGPSGLLGLVLVVIVILVLMERIHFTSF